MDINLKPGKDAMGLTRIVPGNAQDIGSRDEQQDAFGFSDFYNPELVRKKGGMAVVADGMGGLYLGGHASSLAVRVMLEAYFERSSEETVPQALQRALLKANSDIIELADRSGLAGGQVGTTLIAAVIYEDKLYWVSVGDSRIYLFRHDRPIRLTSDHSYLNKLLEEVEKGGLSEEEAFRDKDLGALTSYLGLPGLKEIDSSTSPLAIEPGDRVLLCTDGLHGVLSENEMLELMGFHPQVTAEKLVEQAKSREKKNQDNITVAIIGIE